MKKTRALFTAIAVLAALVSLAGCSGLHDMLFGEDAVADTTFDISGKVVNVRAIEQTSLPTAGTVEVRKFGETAPVATGTIASDGSYTVADLDSGSYLVTFKDAAETPAWFGIPVSVQVAGGDVADVGALAYTDAPEDSILLVAVWDNKSYDIDSHSMVGVEGSATDVYYGNKTLTSPGVVTLERDVTKTNIANGYYPAETTMVTSLASGTELRFYVKCFTETGSVSGLDAGTESKQPAGVKVYAMYQASASEAVNYGMWTAPLNTDETTVGMVRIVGNDDGSLTVGSFSMGTSDTLATGRAIAPTIGKGVVVAEMK